MDYQQRFNSSSGIAKRFTKLVAMLTLDPDVSIEQLYNTLMAMEITFPFEYGTDVSNDIFSLIRPLDNDENLEYVASQDVPGWNNIPGYRV